MLASGLEFWNLWARCGVYSRVHLLLLSILLSYCLTYLLPVSSGSEAAWCLHPASSSGTFGHGAGSTPVFTYYLTSYGLDWCAPVRVRFGVQVTPALDTRRTVSSRVKLGLADSDSERNI